MRQLITACLLLWAAPVVAQAPGSTFNQAWTYYVLKGDTAWSQGNVVFDDATFTMTKQSDGRVHVGLVESGLQAQINVLQAQLTALQTQIATPANAKVAFFDGLNQRCVTCIDSINVALANVPGPLFGMIICCGPATMPATPADSQLIYIRPADPANPIAPKP